MCTLGSSIITPGLEDIQSDLGVSSEVSLLPYVLYVLGLACGPMVAAPCSETFGRRTVYLISMSPFALFTLGAGFSSNIASLTLCRFFAGLFGSTGLAIGSATMSEIWSPADRGLPMAIYVSTPFLGPAIGPLVGGFAAQSYGWQWTQWVLLFFTLAFVTPALFMSESYKPVILHRVAKNRGLKPSTSQKKKRTLFESAHFFLRKTLTRPIHMAFVEPVVAGFTIYIALNFGMLYGFFAAFPYVFSTNYGYGIGSIGLTFLGLGVGVIVGCCIIILFSRVIYRRQLRNSTESKLPPEARLQIAMIGSIMLPISLFWFAWSAENSVLWICPVAAEAVFGCGNLLIYMAAVLYLMDFYGPVYGASAMGANNLGRYIFGAAFPLFIVQMYEGLGVGWATSLLGFVSLALTPIPWVFWIWGPRLRVKSRYVKA